MQRSWEISRGWLYVGMFIALIMICFSPVKEYWQLSTKDEQILISKLPPSNPEQMFQRVQKLRAVLEAPPRSNPMDYYKTVGKVYRIEGEQQQYERRLARMNDLDYKLRSFMSMMQTKIMQLQVAYWDRYGREKMYELAKNNRSAIDTWTDRTHRSYVSYASVWQELGKAYFYSVLLALVFFCARLRDEQCKVLLEVWRILPIALAWPGTIFLYPHRVNPRKQLRQALAFCMYLLTAAFSFGNIGLVKAAEQVKGGSSGSSKKTVQVLDENSSGLGLSVTNDIWSKYVLGIGKIPHDGSVNQTTISISHKATGLFVEVWGSTDLHGKENGGREVDLTVGWQGNNTALGLAYFDLSPLQSDRHGDIVSSYLEVFYPQKLPYNLTVKPGGKLELMAVTTNTERLSDWVGTASLGATWKPHDRVNIDQHIRAIYDGGVFGGDHGVLLRYDAAMSVTLTNHLSVAPIQFKHFEPLMGLHDRGAVSVLGVGLTLSY